MSKKRILCLVLTALMVISVFAVPVSAKKTDSNMAEVACDPIWFEVQDLLDEAYALVEASDEYTFESRMALKEVADSVDVISSNESTVELLQDAIYSLVPIGNADDDYEYGCDLWIEEVITQAQELISYEYLYTEESYSAFLTAYANMLGAVGEYERESAAFALQDAIDSLEIADDELIYVQSDNFASEHPYSNNTSRIWVVSDPGADSIELEFSAESVLEEGYDFVYIYDGDGNPVSSYTGKQLAGEHIVIECDTVKVKLVTDSSTVKYGFDCVWKSNKSAEKEAVIKVNDSEYSAKVGSTVTYTVDMTAAELFENIQAVITYDSDALEIIPYTVEKPAVPNLDNAIININNPGYVKFNHTDVDGVDFTDGKVLITLRFNVKKAVESEIDLNIDVMTIIGDEDHYFLNGKPVKEDGIVISETLESKTLILGDATENGEINIKDATAVQKHICQLITLSESALICADADCDGKVTVKDATAIQKYIADFEVTTPIGSIIDGGVVSTKPTDPEESEVGGSDVTDFVFPICDGYNTIVFSVSEWETAYLYAWGGENQFVSWPGKTMNYAGQNDYGEKLYYIMVTDDYTNFILNNAAGEQTVDLEMMGNVGVYLADTDRGGHYYVGIWEPEFEYEEVIPTSTATDAKETETTETVPEYTIPDDVNYAFPTRMGYNTIVFADDHWDEAYIYAWGIDNDEFVWPGKKMKYACENDNGTKYFYFMVPEAYTGFIVNNGTDEQTVELEITGNVGVYLADTTFLDWYNVGTWEPEFQLNPEVDICPETKYASGGYVESKHNYKSYSDITWIIENEEAQSVELDFKNNTFVEDGYDYISIYDRNDNLIGKYTGDELAAKTVTVDGNVAKIRLTSDYSEEFYGFICWYKFIFPDDAVVFGLRGDFNGWAEPDYFKDNGDGTYSVAIMIPEGSYSFKIVDEVNMQWLSNESTIYDTCENYAFRRSASRDCQLEATGGFYIFTIHTDNNGVVRLSIEYEEYPDGYHVWWE